MEKVQDYVSSEQFIWSIAIIVFGILLYVILSRILESLLKRRSKHARLERRRKTYIKMARSVVCWGVILIVALALLQVNGVNVNSILAGLGVGALIAGLALQDALKDIIMGFNLIIDDYFAVGDVVEYKGHRGIILELGLKVTKARSLKDNGIITIANRNISEVHVVSHQFDINIPVAYEHKIDQVEKAILVALQQCAKIPAIENSEYKGLEKFDKSAIIYQISLSAKPTLQGQVKRDVNRIIKQEFDKRKIQMPYPQLTIHQAKS